MTLSKETIGSVIEKLEHFSQNLKWTDVRGAQDLLAAADGLRELLERRERDKQEPIGYTYNRGINCEIVAADLNADCPCGIDLYAAPPATSYTETMLRGAQAQMRCILADLDLPENTPFVEVLNAIYKLQHPEPLAPIAQPVQVPDESDPRDAFEKEFPIPAHVSRCGNGYVVHEYNAWSAHDYVKKWEGWDACRAAALNQTHVKQPASNSPAAPDDVRRMDWLVSKTVNVREPLVYGSHNIFWSQAITDEQDEHHATALREQIDAAIMAEESAAPKQESE